MKYVPRRVLKGIFREVPPSERRWYNMISHNWALCSGHGVFSDNHSLVVKKFAELSESIPLDVKVKIITYNEYD